MPLDPKSFEERYFKAREKLDATVQQVASTLKSEIHSIALGKAIPTLSLMKEWAEKFSPNIKGFNQLINIAGIQRKVGAAYADYSKYVFHYRLVNNLPKNILYRKILSFEIHFFCKHGILKAETINPFHLSLIPSENERLFYLSPYAHFTFYRLQKDFHARLPPINQVSQVMELIPQVTRVLRSNLEEFFSQYNYERQPGLDDFRIFLDRRDTTNIRQIIEYLEKQPTSWL